MSQQLSGTAGLIYDHPTFADYVVEDWSPEPAGEVQEHTDAKGDTYSSTEVNPGERVSAKMAVKATKAVPVNHTVLTATFAGPTTKKYIVTDIKEMRDGALLKFTCNLLYRTSMANPA